MSGQWMSLLLLAKPCMNVAASSFRPDLAKKAFESTFDLERELKSVQKKHPPFAQECDFVRDKLRKAYEDVIFLDFNFAHEQGVETSLWMKVHHKSIEAYRSRISKFNSTYGRSKPVEFRKLLLSFTNFIKNATRYYRGFIQRLITHFRVSELEYVLKAFKLDMTVERSDNLAFSKELKELVVRSCHVSLVYLGDLSRYRELQSAEKPGAKQWGPALGYYQFARKLLPEAGSPMNQLAVIAIYTENPLGSTYYFMRAICAIEEFPTARDNLALGFKKTLSRESNKKPSVGDLFVSLHASIYLKENYSTAQMDQEKMLKILETLIFDRLIATDTIVQFACINIGAAQICQRPSKGTESSKLYERKSEQYLQLNLGFLSLLLRIFIKELSQTTPSTADLSSQITSVIRRILPTLRICSKWLKLHYLAARPIWNQYLQAMTLCGCRFPPALLPAEVGLLEEDMDLRGFSPLNSCLAFHGADETESVSHPNEQALWRIGALLVDAAELVIRIDQEVAGKNSGDSTAGKVSQGAQSGINEQSFSQVTAAFDRSDLDPVDPATTRRLPDASMGDEAASVSHASEPSMAFSLNKMVDSLVGDEELVFRGRKHTSSNGVIAASPLAASGQSKEWTSVTPQPDQVWASSGSRPTPNQGR